MFDSADVYSGGLAEEILGQAIKGRRDQVLISTKATFSIGPGPNEVGSSRHHLLSAVRGQPAAPGHRPHRPLPAARLRRDRPRWRRRCATLDDLVRAGKVRYIGCSNFSGWHLMKSLAVSERLGLARYVAHQAYYSLVGREYEWELMPLGLDQGVGDGGVEPAGVGASHRQDPPRAAVAGGEPARNDVTMAGGPPVADEHLYRVVDALDAVARRPARRCRRSPLTGSCSGRRSRRSSSARATRSSSARTWARSGGSSRPRSWRRLDAASAAQLAYPYWHQRQFEERNPPPVKLP